MKIKYQNKNARNCPPIASIIRELRDIRDGRQLVCKIIWKAEVCSLLDIVAQIDSTDIALDIALDQQNEVHHAILSSFLLFYYCIVLSCCTYVYSYVAYFCRFLYVNKSSFQKKNIYIFVLDTSNVIVTCVFIQNYCIYVNCI